MMTSPLLSDQAVNLLYFVGWVLAAEKTTSQLTQNPQNLFMLVLCKNMSKYMYDWKPDYTGTFCR